MKYGIKLKIKGENGEQKYSWYSWFPETNGSKVEPLSFESVEDAELYAQNHELKNFIIEST
jgi:hypothetical protein